MPRGRRLYRQSFGPFQATDRIPKRYLVWMQLSGVDVPLAQTLWGALEGSRHHTAQQVHWFFTKLEQKPVAAIASQMESLAARITAHQWVEMLEQCVTDSLLSRHDANQVSDAVLRWTGVDGRWRYGG